MLVLKFKHLLQKNKLIKSQKQQIHLLLKLNLQQRLKN